MSENIKKTCCFTGHREIPAERTPEIAGALRTVLIKLINAGFFRFCTGGAQGFDTIAARVVLELKRKYPHIELILVLPYPGQAKHWDSEAARAYEKIKNEADEVVYTSGKYFRGCTQKSNRYLVEQSQVCVCYLSKPIGDTAYIVNYSRKKGCLIWNISDDIQ